MNLSPIDPLWPARTLWPKMVLYARQLEVIESVEYNDETFVHAGNKLGKDYVAGYIALSFFLRYHPVRIVTTSVRSEHLKVLWGEIKRLIESSVIPLDSKKGGPLILLHREIRKRVRGEECPLSYLIGTTSKKGEGLAGHHAPYTLLIGDEASGLDEQVHEMGQGWAKRMLFIGNPNPSQGRFFERLCKQGDVLAET